MVSIIIINYNTCDLTCNCIKSVIENTKDIAYEIIVVDNASSDNSIKEIKKLFSEISLIESNENLGFGRANNLGAQHAKGEFLFFLNSDTILFENSIRQMVDFFSDNEVSLKIGSLGCILVDANKIVNGAGGTFPTSKKEARALLRSLPFIGKLFALKETTLFPLERPYFEIDYVLGADLMMRAAVFHQLNGFDPAFFMYYEESDLQKRVLDKFGMKSYIYTQTQIIHLEGASGGGLRKHNNKKRIAVFNSKNIYLGKHDPANIKFYKRVEALYCFLNKFNANYKKGENEEFLAALKKYKQN